MWFIAKLTYLFVACAGCTNGQAYPPEYYVPAAKNFTQKLDHQSSDNKVTFLQLYQIDTTHFKPGGPILFHQSEEAAMIPLAANMMFDYAKSLGGISATLEHRFFGTSFPQGQNYNNTVTGEDFKALTLDNVLQDSVEFVKWIKMTVPGAENSPTFYAGGSYGGFLAVMARIRHPEVFQGALSIAPGLRSFGQSITLKENPFKFAANDWVANIYWDASSQASVKIKNATKAMDDCVKASNCAKVLKGLNLCSPPSPDSKWADLLQIILTQYATIPQFNYAANKPQSIYPPDALNLLINLTEKATTPAQVLRIPIDFYLKTVNTNQSVTCADTSLLKNGVEQFGIGPSWGYISCSYLLASESAIGPDNSLFSAWDTDKASNGCSSSEHPDWVDHNNFNKTNAEWEAMYGITDEELDRITNLLIVHGSWDRTAAVGTPKLTSSSSRSQARVILASGMAHGESAMSEAALPRGIRVVVDQTRDIQLNYLQEWIATLKLSGKVQLGHFSYD